MKDISHQAHAFKLALEATINAAHIRSISLQPPLAGMDVGVSTKFYNEWLIYKLSFPRQIGKTTVVHDLWESCSVRSVYGVFSKENYNVLHYNDFIENQIGKRLFIIDGFTSEELEVLIIKTVQKSVETGLYSPIIIVE